MYHPLLSPADALEVQAIFESLANDTRLRILHHLVRSNEATVTELGKALQMKTQAVSNQLTRLHDRKIVAKRREGGKVYYRVTSGFLDPLLGLALSLMEDERSRTRNGTL